VEQHPLSSELDTYRSDLMKLNDWAMSCSAIGSNTAYQVLSDEQSRVNAIRHSAHTVNVELDDWIHNFAYNFQFMPKRKSGWDEMVIKESAIVVGAGPSLTDDQLLALDGYEGTVICVNKSLDRMYSLGLVPDWAIMLHTTDEILPHFTTPAVRENLHRSNVILSSIGHPSVTDEVLAHANPERTFWYNPSIPSCFAPNVDRMMAVMTNEIVVDTGGNVGIWGLVLANIMKAKKVGLLGMEHCHDITKVTGWDNEKAATYDYQWAPEDDQVYCLTPMFKAYLLGLVNFINRVREETEVYNLTPFGPMYAQRNIHNEEFHGVPYLTPQEFVRRFS